MTETTAEFRNWTLHAPDARIARMSEIVMQAIQPEQVFRVLDVGCGSGAQIRQLAALLPEALFDGIDISTANIAAARAAAVAHPAAARMHFEAADYLQFRDRPYDLVVSDGVLHLMEASDEALASKLGRDVAAGGTLVVAMATDSLYNHWFARARQMLRTRRSPALDRFILSVARLLHGRQMSTELLAERVEYMYMPPRRLFGANFEQRLAAAGLERIAIVPMASTSPSQLTHAAIVFRKRGGVAGVAG
jgi:trans-aconitate methyltransferase